MIPPICCQSVIQLLDNNECDLPDGYCYSQRLTGMENKSVKL